MQLVELLCRTVWLLLPGGMPSQNCATAVESMPHAQSAAKSTAPDAADRAAGSSSASSNAR